MAHKHPVINKISEKLLESMFDLTKDELESIMLEIKSLSTTNCWWVSYGIRNTLYEIAKGRLESDSLLLMEKGAEDKKEIEDDI